MNTKINNNRKDFERQFAPKRIKSPVSHNFIYLLGFELLRKD